MWTLRSAIKPTPLPRLWVWRDECVNQKKEAKNGRTTNRSECSFVDCLQHAHGTHSFAHWPFALQTHHHLIDGQTNTLRKRWKILHFNRKRLCKDSDGTTNENEEMRHQFGELFIFIIHLQRLLGTARFCVIECVQNACTHMLMMGLARSRRRRRACGPYFRSSCILRRCELMPRAMPLPLHECKICYGRRETYIWLDTVDVQEHSDMCTRHRYTDSRRESTRDRGRKRARDIYI